MNVTLEPTLEVLVRQKIEAGEYADESAVVSEALLLLDERDRERRLRAALKIGLDQIERGETHLYTPELLDQIEQEAIEANREGKHPKTDVVP